MFGGQEKNMGGICYCSSGQGGWNLRYVKNSNDWKLDLDVSLSREVQRGLVILDEDVVLWKAVEGDRFSVGEAYTLLHPPSLLLSL